MGAFLPIATMALTVAGQAAASNAQRSAAKQQAAAQAASAQAEARAIEEQAATDEAERARALRAALAARRAGLAASGVGTAGGSGRAVLLGLAKRADEEAESEARLTAHRLGALGVAADYRRRRNLLELAEERRRGALGLVEGGLRLGSALNDPWRRF